MRILDEHWNTTERGGALHPFTLRINRLWSIIHLGCTFWNGEFSRSVTLSVPNGALIFRWWRIDPNRSLVCPLLQLAPFHFTLRLPSAFYNWDELASNKIASECIQYPTHKQHKHLNDNCSTKTAMNIVLGVEAIYEQKCNLCQYQHQPRDESAHMVSLHVNLGSVDRLCC